MDLQGTILRIDGTNCLVHCQDKTYRAYFKKHIIGANPDEIKPITVGDIVIVEERTPDEVLLKEVLPRKTWLMRQAIGRPGKRQVIVANIEQLLIITSIADPAFNHAILDRFIVAAGKGKLQPILVVNKYDLRDKEPTWTDIFSKMDIYRSLGYPCFYTSIHDADSIKVLHQALIGHSTAVVGHSGVGKSSLLSCIDPSIQLRVGEINPISHKGRHTTTSITFFPLRSGGFVVDTPGIREFTMWKMESWEVSQYYPEMLSELHTCKYKKCTHTHEPYCAVKIALEEKKIAEFRYQSYCKIVDGILHPEIEKIETW